MNTERGRLPEPDERETPDSLFAPLHERYRFTLDAAASDENAKLPRYNTRERPGSYSWRGERVWCNPPYSNISQWVLKAFEREAELVYMLVPNWTDRVWWQTYIEPWRDLPNGDLTTTFFKRHRFLYKGQPILTKTGKVGSPEFGLVGLLWRRK
jgi:phage N-6-adenine-methyltransferase